MENPGRPTPYPLTRRPVNPEAARVRRHAPSRCVRRPVEKRLFGLDSDRFLVSLIGRQVILLPRFNGHLVTPVVLRMLAVTPDPFEPDAMLCREVE